MPSSTYAQREACARAPQACHRPRSGKRRAYRGITGNRHRRLLAAAVLVGTALNAIAGLWWADPLAGLVIIYYAAIEGIAHWKEGRA